MNPQKNFDVNRYCGKWYEQSRTWFWPEESGVCSRATYTKRDENSINVKNEMRVGSPEGGIQSIEGTATLRTPNEGHLLVDFGGHRTGNMKILETDYTSYSLVYSCYSFAGLLHWETAWILTRDAQISDQFMDTLMNKYKKIGFDTSRLKRQTQDKKCWGPSMQRVDE